MSHYVQISVSNTDIFIRSTNSPFVFHCKYPTIGCYFFHLYLYNTNCSSDMNDTLVSDPQNHDRKRRATCTILILGIAMNDSVGNVHENGTLLYSD